MNIVNWRNPGHKAYRARLLLVILASDIIANLQNSNNTSCRPCTNPFSLESNSGLAFNIALIAINVTVVAFVAATFIAAAVAAKRAKKAGTEPPSVRVPLLAHHHSSAGRGRGMSAATGATALARGASKSRRSATAADLRDMYDVIDEDYIAEKEHDGGGGGRDAHNAPSPAAAAAALTQNSNDDSYDIFSGQRDAENLLKILFKPQSLESRDEVDGRYLTVTGTESEERRTSGGGRARLASLWPSAAKNRPDLNEVEMGTGSVDGRKASEQQPGSAAAAHNNLWSIRQLLREYEIRRSDPEVKRRRGSPTAFKSLRSSGSSGGPQSILSRRDSEMPSPSPPTSLAPPPKTVARHHGRRRVAVSFLENGGEAATRHGHRNSRDSAPRENEAEAEAEEEP